ncbi:winged helix DNA-binding protein [Staphylococcus pasteuri]|uniref:MarR family winged helix-turn-helix transcriptional regulator n=1 Tax=Staphylococcus pasteuri TaxID=45972 RepID=UPI001E5D201B|nr:MarR family transcriptional regulator [Staphylococcus pasteuri]MCD9065687.1 winged helix DNA-binding protein [Staphylococcus pasteuri]WAE40991.1 winged helix DNA-binding protein [Staphylococcus pasteuri]
MKGNELQQFNQFHLTFIEISKIINEVIDEENIDISREQLGIFKLLLEHKQLSVNQIAEKQGVYKTAISKRIKKLETKHFVERIKSEDKREKVIQLTEEGLQFYNNRQNKLYEGFKRKLNLNSKELNDLFDYTNHINDILKKDEE